MIKLIIKIAIILMAAAWLTSCARDFSPAKAASSGGKTCKDRHRIR
jgi:hypothetical protein